MSANAALPPPKLPALRLTTEGACVLEGAVPLDTGFSISYAPTGRVSWATSPAAELSVQQSASRAEGPTSEEDTSLGSGPGLPEVRPASVLPDPDPELTHPQVPVPPPPVNSHSIQTPPFTRTTSMPLPPQLNQLQHPHRTTDRSSPVVSLDSPQSIHVKELSYELADSIQMIVQTLLQISPPQVLDPVKEHFTACSLSVPTSSMSAMFTVMKNINYISANMSSYFGEPSSSMSSRRAEKQPAPPSPPLDLIEFDVGETLQAVGDSLSGCAAQAGVDLVLYHGDVSLKHVSVYGDEASLRYAITQVMQQVLNTVERGDSVELGLLLTPISTDGVAPQHPHDPGNSRPTKEGEDPVSRTLTDVPLRCTIRISHKFAFPERREGDPYGPEPEQTRLSPNLSTISIRQILRHTSSTLRSDLPPPSNFPTGRTTELEFPLRRARSSFLFPLPQISEQGVQHDITLAHLIAFAETLNGKGVTLYASAKGCFAQRLTSYLTTWGMVVSHVTPEGAVDGVTDLPANAAPESRGSGYGALSGSAALLALAGKLDSSKVSGFMPEAEGRKPISFVFIDDDVEILKERLHALRQEQAPAPFLHSMKRPPLASLHRPRSTNQVPFVNSSVLNRPSPPIVILHFTSLSNYKHLKETVQSIVATYVGTGIPVPEVMILPKPAGPRRFLAALHTAVTKPTVDPQFSPIATSPMSPITTSHSLHFGPSPTAAAPTTTESAPRPSTIISQPASPTKPVRPTGSRSNSDRSVKSTARDTSDPAAPVIPPSPLSIPDNMEYFSAAAQKLGTTPSSGFVIQSPDGQPAGILFRPNLKARGSRNSPRILSTPSMERDQGQRTPPLSVSVSPRRVSSNARVAPGGVLDFRTLHAASGSPSPSGLPPLPGPSSASAPTVPATPLPRPPSPLGEKPIIVGTSATLQTNNASAALPTSAPTMVATTRKSSLGSKTQSPPGSPQGDGSRRLTTRKSSAGDKDISSSSSMPASASTVKKSKLGESNIIPPISVLIVDDNPINQTILSTFMRKKKIKYDIANNGAEAVQKWRTGGFHLILMDIQMPIMDGIEATKEIRRLEKTNASGFPQLTPITEGQRTPSDTSESRSAASPYRSSVIIVALTASSLQSDRYAALAAGCNDFLTKPVSLLWLNNKIIEWGSIKALQMWADLRPDMVRSMHTGQAVQARAVADNLHMPPRKKTPSPKRSSSLKEEQDAAIALASPSGSGMIPQAVQKAIATAEMNANANALRASSGGSRLALVASPSPIASRRASGSPVPAVSRVVPPVRGTSGVEHDGVHATASSIQELEHTFSAKNAKTCRDPMHDTTDDPSTTKSLNTSSQETITPEKSAVAEASTTTSTHIIAQPSGDDGDGLHNQE